MVFVYEGDHIVYFNDANLSPTVSVAAMPHKAPRSRRSSSSSRSSTSIYPSSDIEGGNFDHHIPSGAKSTYGKPSPRIPADDASLDGLYDEFLSHIVISGPAARDASQIPNLPLSPGDRFPPSPSQPSTPNVTEPLHIRKRSTPTPERDNRGGSRLLWRSSFPPSLLSSPVPQYSGECLKGRGLGPPPTHTQDKSLTSQNTHKSTMAAATRKYTRSSVPHRLHLRAQKRRRHHYFARRRHLQWLPWPRSHQCLGHCLAVHFLRVPCHAHCQIYLFQHSTRGEELLPSHYTFA